MMEAKEIAERIVEEVLNHELFREQVHPKQSELLKLADAHLELLAKQEGNVLVPLEPDDKTIVMMAVEIKKPFQLDVQRARNIYKAMIE